MNRNVGGIDRLLRIAVGLAAMSAGLYFRSWWGALGMIPLLTGIMCWCPVYLPFGMSSCRVEAKSRA